MTDTLNDDIEVWPPLRLPAQTIADLHEARTGLAAATVELVSALQRAADARSLAYAALDAHPHGQLDEMWKQVPGLEELEDEVHRISKILDEWESGSPDWSRLDDI